MARFAREDQRRRAGLYKAYGPDKLKEMVDSGQMPKHTYNNIMAENHKEESAPRGVAALNRKKGKPQMER